MTGMSIPLIRRHWNGFSFGNSINPEIIGGNDEKLLLIIFGYGFILGVIIEIQSKSLYVYRLGAISYIILAIMSFFLSQLLYPNSLSIKEEVVEGKRRL